MVLLVSIGIAWHEAHVVVSVAVLSCGEVGAARGTRLTKRYVGLYTGPYFDPSAPNNITTQLGTHAYLPCKVTSTLQTLLVIFTVQINIGIYTLHENKIKIRYVLASLSLIKRPNHS